MSLVVLLVYCVHSVPDQILYTIFSLAVTIIVGGIWQKLINIKI